MSKKILGRGILPIDLCEGPTPITHQAAMLARHFHSEILMLHVITPLTYSAGSLEGEFVPRNIADLEAELIRSAKARLDRILAPELGGLTIKRISLAGDPARLIVETARKEKTDLIAMPTHGYGAFRRFLLGSVTAKVLHDSDIPVWTAAHLGESSAPPFALRHVVCGIDMKPHSLQTAQIADQLAAELGARLTLVHVTPGIEPYGPGAYNFESAWHNTFRDAVAQDIAQLQQKLTTQSEVIIESGDPAAVLNGVVTRIQGDLLVIGRPPTGRLRGTGYGIIRESHLPVLSV